MLNYTHRPCEAGGDRVDYQAAALKRKYMMNKNYFNYLLSVRLGRDTRFCKTIDLKDLNDFPKYSVPKMKDKIAYGPYQINQGKSYIRDYKIDSTGYILSTDLLRKVKNSMVRSKVANCKIVAYNLEPRHKRSTKTGTEDVKLNYRIYIVYEPHNNHSKAIRGNGLNSILILVLNNLFFKIKVIHVVADPDLKLLAFAVTSVLLSII
jgi:hypothetical protein